jgi:Tfp pilus assembly protein PilZ
MPDAATQERRTAVRYQYDFPVALQLVRDPTLRAAAHTRDIAAGGIFIHANMRLPLGEEVAITLNLPKRGKKSRLLTIGRVVRVENTRDEVGLAVTIDRCAFF